MVAMNFSGPLRRITFKGQIQEFVATMQMAVNAAAESDRRYEVIIDLAEQKYTLRQMTSPDVNEVLEEEIIVENDFSESCYVDYIVFDDLERTDDNSKGYEVIAATFRAGRAGWQNGGKIVFLDRDDQPYSIIVNRLNGIITLKEGDVTFLLPKDESEVLF
jgi:hypothetical protein